MKCPPKVARILFLHERKNEKEEKEKREENKTKANKERKIEKQCAKAHWIGGFTILQLHVCIHLNNS